MCLLSHEELTEHDKQFSFEAQNFFAVLRVNHQVVTKNYYFNFRFQGHILEYDLFELFFKEQQTYVSTRASVTHHVQLHNH